ncbi:MAG: hypothetical protein ACK5V3_18340 [Bdellovibrionales bacterium]
MKSCLVFAILLATTFAQAQRPPRVEGREGESIVIRVDEDDRQDRNQNQRIRELEKAVRDLQLRVYEIEDLVIGNRPPARPTSPVCTILGSGVYAGLSYSYRVAMDGNVLSGHYNIQDAFSSIERFKSNRICSLDTTSYQCNLLGSGVYSGLSYSYRVGIKNLNNGQNEVVSGHYNQQDALSMMNRIRQVSLCQ